ncbi:mitochondrial carrier domain-containing protein, partial [Thamnocephalis sphaerospora]
MATITDQRLSVEPIRRSEGRLRETSKLGPRPWLHLVAGGVGGTVGAMLTCPLEVIKTRMQSSLYRGGMVSVSRPHSRGLLTPFADIGRILGSIYRQEGAGALFKGLGPNLVGVIPSRAIQFAVYGNGKRLLTELNGGKESSLIHLVSAATAGKHAIGHRHSGCIATATATNPIWLVKTRMQLQANAHGTVVRQYRNSIDCVIQVLRTEGIRGLYRGLSASYLGVTEGTLQWVTYEHLKTIIRQR